MRITEERISHDDKNQGNMKGFDLFIFKYNLLTKNAYYKINSSSPLLFYLLLFLRGLEMREYIILHVIHVIGTSIQACGIDVLSRGVPLEEVMKERSLISFVPLNKSYTER